MSGPYGWCLCDPTSGESCPECSGDGRDQREQRAQARERARQREHLLRTDPKFRVAWIASFPQSMQEPMAEYADKVYGRLPAPERVA